METGPLLAKSFTREEYKRELSRRAVRALEISALSAYGTFIHQATGKINVKLTAHISWLFDQMMIEAETERKYVTG